jgi:hypothetical protein
VHNAADYDALTDLFMSDHPLLPASQSAANQGDIDVPQIPPLRTPRLRLAEAIAPRKDDTSVPALADRPHVEGLILGHLPVLGAAWVTQYAKFIAETRGHNVALLRAHEGQTWLDIVQPRHAAAIAAIPEDAGEPDLLAASARARELAQSWILRVDDCHEPDLLSLASLSAITLLTGADDPAILASYRTIKHLAQLCESLGRPLAAADDLTDDRTDETTKDTTDAGLRMQLVIMGADAAKAAEADAKIRRSALAFLGAALAPAQSIAKIGACGTTALYRGASTATIEEVLHERKTLSDDADGADGATGVLPVSVVPPTIKPTIKPAPTFKPSTPPTLTLIPAAPKAHSLEEIKPQNKTEAKPLAQPAPAQPTSPQRVAASAQRSTSEPLPELPPLPTRIARTFASTVVASAPAPSVAAVVSSDQVQTRGQTKGPPQGPHALDLIAMIASSDVPSLRALPITCPYAKGVAFGVDATGSLHAAAAAAHTHADEASAMAALHTARQWAAEHASLLQAFVPQSTQLATSCTLHILTPNNAQLRTLMHAPVRVHLLVSVAGKTVASRVL